MNKIIEEIHVDGNNFTEGEYVNCGIEQAKHPDMCKPKKRRLIFNKITEKHYGVWNKRNENLGAVDWDPDWKTFVWTQFKDIQMSWECMDEVSNFQRMLEAAK